MPAQLSKLTPATRLFSTRERLVDTGLYLGHMSLRDSVHWVRDGRADRLAIKLAEPSDVGKRLPSPPDDDALLTWLPSRRLSTSTATTTGSQQTRTIVDLPKSGQTMRTSNPLVCVKCQTFRPSPPTGRMSRTTSVGYKTRLRCLISL